MSLEVHNGDSKFECPLCGLESESLFPVGTDTPILNELEVIGAGRREAGCYGCGSYDRERLIYCYLRDELRIFGDRQIQDVLHIAPEPQLAKLIRKIPGLNYVCGDKFSAGYSYPEDVLDVDITDLQFPDLSFDLVICNHVLEHVANDIAALSELHRVLKIGGTAILQVPISKKLQITEEDLSIVDPTIREQRFGQFDHVRIYGLDYLARLLSVGFDVKLENISQRYPLAGLNPEEDIFVAVKTIKN